ncbi:hypothetical protein SPLC1_S200110 [Arthrospira platensis C1]|nr:hypothetical protein SPLC1_S200110 [Arthrospira platensis C1]
MRDTASVTLTGNSAIVALSGTGKMSRKSIRIDK